MNMNNINALTPFYPEKLPLNHINELLREDELIDITIKASEAMGTYIGFLKTATNPMLLIAPLLTMESVVSSKLEGTHATYEDFLNYEAGNETLIRDDEMLEIMNYRNALYYALDNIATINSEEKNKLPLTSRIIKEMHGILLSNVRGASKNPGNYKRHQNYIGSSNEISFTPVPPDATEEYMANLEKYIHIESPRVLVQSAIMHAQFEMIHPFEDGNGRIGRLLIPLFLYYREILPYPTFYMSEFFEKDRNRYIEKLSNISLLGDWRSWLVYYLEGVLSQAKNNVQKANNLMNLYDDLKEKVRAINSKHAISIIDYIFQHPVFKATQLIDSMGKSTSISPGTVYNLLNRFVELDILQVSEAKRNKTYICISILQAATLLNYGRDKK